MTKLASAQHERFCREYVVDNQGGKAAVRAKYSPRSASVQASRLLKKPAIIARIKELQDEIGKRLSLSAERVAEELGILALTNLSDVVDISGGSPRLKGPLELKDPRVLSAISEVSETPHGLKIKMYNKNTALDSLADFLGMNKKRVELSGPEGAPVEAVFNINFIKSRKKDSK